MLLLAILVGLLGVLITAVGVIAMLTAFMPKFGGGDEAWAFPFGLAFFGCGIAVIFYAGTLTP